MIGSLSRWTVRIATAVSLAAGWVTAHADETAADVFERLKGFRYGDDRIVLFEVSRAVNARGDDPEALTTLEQRLSDVLTSESTVDAKAYACMALGQLGSATAVPAIAPLLTDPDLALAARSTLERLPGSAAHDALANAIESGTDALLRAGLAASLGNRRDEAAVPVLAALLSDEAVPVRTAALRALGHIGGEAATHALIGAYTPSDCDVAYALAECADSCLGTDRTEAAADLYHRLFHHNDPNVQAAGLTGFVEARPERAAHVIAAVLASPTPQLRRTALRLVVTSPAPGLADAVVGRAPDLPADELELVLHALASRPDAESRDAVARLCDDADERIRNAATAAVAADQPLAAAVPPDDHPCHPNGAKVVAYLDCGLPRACVSEGPEVRQLRGSYYRFAAEPPAIATVTFDPERVEFALDSLARDADYALAFTWQDVDGNGRIQSVEFGVGDPVVWTTVLPSAPPLAYHADQPTWARVILPITASFRASERMRVAFVNKGPANAVVSEVWLLELPEAAATPRKRVLIVTGDDYAGHLWRETAPELAAVIREDSRLEVAITESPAFLGSPLLDHYDAIVLHFKDYSERLPLGDEVRNGLQRYVESGRGLVVAHFGCGAFQGWDGLARVIGRVWNPSLPPHDPYGEFVVRVSDSGHPITASMSDFTTQDELYTCLDGTDPIQTLCDAVSVQDQRRYPMAFVVPGPGGRVFHSPLGHDVNALRAEGVRALYRRAAAWASGCDP